MDWTHRIAGLALATLLPAVAGASTPKGMVEVREEVLDNGLKVLLLENHRSPAVTFQVWYRVGSRNEVDGKSGMAHFLEHMLFKGTDKVAPEEYARIIRKHGGRSNAFTSHDATAYHATMSRDTIGIAVELEADRMVNTRFEEKFFVPEKKVVQEERRMRVDRPRAALAEITTAVTYAVHPYRRPIIGWPEDVQRMTLEDMKAFYRTYYSPNNAFIVAAGNFDSEGCSRRSARPSARSRGGPNPGGGPDRAAATGGAAGASQEGSPAPLASDELPRAQRRPPGQLCAGRAGDDPVEGAHLAAPPGPGLRPAHRPLRLGRLPPGFRRPHHLQHRAQAMPGKDIADVEAAIDEVIAGVRDKGVTKAELDKARNQVAAAFIFAQESNRGQAMRIGFYEITGGWRRMNEYLGGIQGVTAEDVQRVARQYLDRDRRTVGTLVPQARKRS